VELLLARASALTAAGHFTESHNALRDAAAVVPQSSHALCGQVTRACAGVESLLGRHEQARRRLAIAIERLPDPVSREAVTLMVELAMNGFWRTDYKAMREAADHAVDAARVLDDTPLRAAALAVRALADSMTGMAGRAESGRAEAAALVDRMSDDDLAHRLDAAAWLAGAELYLDRYAEADAHAERTLAIARDTGQGELFLVLVQIQGRVWTVRGKLAQAADLLDGGIEAARLLGNTQALVWNLFNRSVVALAVGDVETALATAQESVDLSQDLDPGFHSAWAAARLAGVRYETGHPQDAIDLLLGSAGGEALVLIPGSWRAYCLELLTRCWLALDRPAQAQRAAASAAAWAQAVHLPLATAWADRAEAAVRLYAGEPDQAADQALASAVTTDKAGAPIEAAISRTLAGRALAQAGDPDRAIAQLQRAAAELHTRGALRYRDHAEHELRTLGQHIQRRTRPGSPGGTGVELLTERELQVARLVVERKTNPEIAAELFLSQKTVESHLHNIFHKVDVTSRVALAHAIERADRTDHAIST